MNANQHSPNYHNQRQLHLSSSQTMKNSTAAICTLKTDGMDIIAAIDISFHDPSRIFTFSPPEPSLTTLLIYARTNEDRSPSIPPEPSTAVSLSMKLPLFLELFCLLPNRPARPPRDLLLPPELDVAPPTQRKTVARKRHATAAHMKPKLYFPRFAAVPAALNALRPWTNAALRSVSVFL